MIDRKKEEAEELKEILGVETKELEEDAKIFFDGKQYTIRIPKKFGDILGVNSKNDRFKFKLTVPPIKEGNPALEGEYIRG